ncbi:MAG: hemolysin family protein [Hyphomicrobiales bacterium]|nr:hemolysin family protein [Hyphomicrobiales bacterium]
MVSDQHLQKPASNGAADGQSDKDKGRWYRRFTSALRFFESESLKQKLEKSLSAEDETGEYFSPDERKLLQNIFSFGALRVDDVMVPRADILAIDEEETLDDLLKLFAKAGHSRVPVYRGSLDFAYGMIHIKDVMRWMTQIASKADPEGPCTLDLRSVDLTCTVKSLKLHRDILFEPESTPVSALLRRMQTTRTHLALIYDEFNSIEGLASIEDLIEPLVGDIEDEHDPVEKPLIVEDETGITVDARAPLEAVNAYLGCDLSLPDDEGDSETVGGLVLTILGRLPSKGEHVKHMAGVDFEVLSVDQNRIVSLRIHPISHDEAASPDRRTAIGSPASKAGATHAA